MKTKEREIWKAIAESLERNEAVMLLVVAQSKGSSPGRRGFKMAVSETSLTGSIGGGVMEVRLAEKARENLKKNFDWLILEQIHRKNVENSSGMICSGKQTIIFYKIKPEHFQQVAEIIKNLENENRCLSLTAKGFEVLEKTTEKESFKFLRKSEKDFIYRENFGFKNRLFIVGGGHCALALSELMKKLDFQISLFDDRPHLNTFEKNEFVNSKKVIESYEKIADFIPSGENNYVVVMTLGYKFDELVIRSLFEKKFKYFGVLGSKAKMAKLLKKLKDEGFSAEKLEKIKTPIGLPIGSQTPEEIAVSIAAEIIAVKNSAN